ncbi:hypothetical protein ACMGOD_004412 [Klebsiella oxytoca]
MFISSVRGRDGASGPARSAGGVDAAAAEGGGVVVVDPPARDH